MTDSASVDTIRRATNMAGIAFGVAGLLAPGALARLYGIRDASPNVRFITRLWGTRTAVVAALVSGAPATGPQRRILGPVVAMNSVDAVVALTTRGIPARTKFLVAATSAAFAGLGAYVLANSKE